MRARLEALAHDLRTPLAIVSGEVELVLANPRATPSERARSAAEVMRALERTACILRSQAPVGVTAGRDRGKDTDSDAALGTVAADGRSRRPHAVSVGLLLTRHPADRISPIMPEVARILEERGAIVEAIHPDETLTDLGRIEINHDLYVLKSGNDSALSLAGALHAAGASILNPYPVAAACRDKIILTQALRRAGVPLPDTFATGDPAQLAPLLEGGPIVVKPYRGSQGRGVRVIRDTDELDALAPDDGPLFAQRYCAAKGRDRKLYRIGKRVFGVKRVWPVRSYHDKLGEPFAVSGELREIAMRCGAAFGIDLYGLDILETDDGPFVVDFASFPGFKGVPNAANLLAGYIWAAARRARADAHGFAAPSPVGAAG